MIEVTQPIVSILVTSIHPEKLIGLMNNIEKTVSNPENIEFIVKVDAEDECMIDLVYKQKKIRKYNIYSIISPKLNGYWSCWFFLNNLLRLASEKSYYIWVPNDEIRIKTYGWDETLKKYYKLFDDDIFHLRLGNYKNHENSFIDCAPIGEHLSFVTKKWWEVTEGIRADATDTGVAFINYHTRKYFNLNRVIPIEDIEFENYDTAVCGLHGLDEEKAQIKLSQVNDAYTEWLSYNFQLKNYYLAAKVYAHVYAQNYLGRNYSIETDEINNIIRISSEIGSHTIDFNYKYSSWLDDIEESIEKKREQLIWPPVAACLIKEKHLRLRSLGKISHASLTRLLNLSNKSISASKLTRDYLRLILPLWPEQAQGVGKKNAAS